MEIGTEISQKIRSAIKAKLIELGAYVDDELPDYIMVMVANKRSQKQMTDDLSLFLSTNTEKFTTWLHGLLKKLQSINTDQVQSKPKHKEKHKTEKKKHRVGGSSEKSGTTGTEKTSTEEKMEESKKPKVEDRENEGKVTDRITSTVKTGEEEPATEISISENTDEFNEENKAIEKAESSIAGKQTQGKKLERSGSGKKLAAKSSSQGKSEKELKKVSKKKPSSFVASVKRKYEFEEEEEEYDPLNPAVGNVASVIRGPTRKSSIPKSMQANRSLLMKAVTDAEKSISTIKKLDISLTDSSAGMKSDQRPVDVRKRLKTAAGLQLISRSTKRRGLEDMTYTIENDVKKPRKSTEELTNLKYTVKNVQIVKPDQKRSKGAEAPVRVAKSALKGITQNVEITKQQEPDADDDNDDDDGQYGPPLPDTRLVHKIVKEDADTYEDSTSYTDSVSDNTPDPEIQKILDEAQDTDLDLNLDSPVSFLNVDIRTIRKEKKTPSPKDPRFIVTLDGVDPTSFTDVQDKPNIVQTVKPMARSPPSKPQPEAGEQPKQHPPAVEPAEFYSKITPPKIRPFNINLKESDDEEEEGEEQPSQTTTPSPSLLERCRFWPACANGSACPYIHPSIPCKTFPHCKFGDKCMYIHPNCKYDAKCARMDCPFTHASKRSTVHPTVIHKIVQVPIQPFIPSRPLVQTTSYTSGGQTNNCKYYPNCRNMNCLYVHPKPCRYGIGCMNKNTCTFYHPALPTKDKLTWTPSNKKQTHPFTASTAQKQTATGT